MSQLISTKHIIFGVENKSGKFQYTGRNGIKIVNHHKICGAEKKSGKFQETGEMEMTHSLSYAKPNSLSPAFFPGKSTVVSHNFVNFSGYNCLPRKLKCSARNLRSFGVVNAFDSESSSADSSVRWLLEPIGDGDTRHIGYRVSRPGAFEIASSEVTVGRVREKADIVIPVPTVSGVHARIQKTDENLLITDLDSTNGTFIGERRLTPGVVAAASPGNLIIFGDTNLAIFRVYKLEEEEFTTEPEISESTPEEADVASAS